MCCDAIFPALVNVDVYFLNISESSEINILMASVSDNLKYKGKVI
jgi:hypothetical protein